MRLLRATDAEQLLRDLIELTTGAAEMLTVRWDDDDDFPRPEDFADAEPAADEEPADEEPAAEATVDDDEPAAPEVDDRDDDGTPGDPTPPR